VIQASLARRYAKALLMIGIQDKTLDTIDAELSAFDQLVLGSKELQAVLADPTVLPSSKRDILKGIVDAMAMSEVIRNFILLLAEKNRIGAFHEIRREFRRLGDEQAGRATATVTSAVPLDKNVEADLTEKLSKLSGRKVELRQKVDPDLLGGMVAEIGGVVYDGSLRTQLRALRESAKG
jgi:F-type H+-transporting ATPase subunit delta